MTDPISSPPAQADEARDVERDAKVDELLLAGLEHYFAERHQEAINVWERVLFLDRGHARARAYIERARGALAERQRQSEQLVQEGVEALNRGDGTVARELLETAIEQGDPQDVAQSYLERLDRLSAHHAAGGRDDRAAERVSAPARAGRPRPSPRRSARPVRALPLLLGAVVIGLAIYAGASRDLLKPFVDFAFRPSAAGGSFRVAPDALPVPGIAELAMARSRDLLAAGRLKPALEALDDVPDTDPAAPEARRLRADIQRTLLESLQAESGAAPATRPGERRQ
jgi:hypothetical protein